MFLFTMPSILKLLQLLIEKGASIYIKAFDGTNALMYAVKFNPLNIAKILLDNSADPNEKVNHGLTPLMIATQEGKYETAKLLIEHGANIDNHENLFGNVLLHLAISFGHIRILRLIIENHPCFYWF